MEDTVFRVMESVGAYGIPQRVPGRTCRECPTRLSSYEPWRLRCAPCSRRRHQAESAVVNMWLLERQKIEELPTDMRENERNLTIMRLRRKAIALSIGILAAPGSGYHGTRQELQSLLPFQSKGLLNRFPKLWEGLIKDGFISCCDRIPDGSCKSGCRLVKLPDMDIDDGFYPDVLRHGSVPLDAEHLMPLYAPSSN